MNYIASITTKCVGPQTFFLWQQNEPCTMEKEDFPRQPAPQVFSALSPRGGEDSHRGSLLRFFFFFLLILQGDTSVILTYSVISYKLREDISHIDALEIIGCVEVASLGGVSKACRLCWSMD